MEKKWQKRRERSARIKLFFKRIRLPLLTVGGTFLTAFIIIPLALGAYEARAESIEVTAPNKQAQPSAQVGGIQPITPEPVMTAEPLPTESTEGFTLDSITPTDAPQYAPQYAPLVYEQRDEAVRTLQQRLMDLYYMGSDETTDYYGPVTRDAVMSFQRAHHLKETGDADEQTQQILFSSAAQSYIINQGCSGEDVLTLQNELKELGYYEDKLNGYFGTATSRATAAFQKKNKLDITGEADYFTLELLYSPKAKPLIDPTPTPTPTPTPKPTKTPKPTATPKPGKTTAPDATSSATAAPTAAPTTAPSTPAPNYGGGVSDFIALAKQQIGVRYVLGGKGPDKFDCSGFVYYCLKPLGKMTRYYNSAGMGQIDSWPTVYGKENLQPGDLLFYKSEGSDTRITHVAIWLGGGKLIHASASEGCVCITSWGSWSDRNFLYGKRVF